MKEPWEDKDLDDGLLPDAEETDSLPDDYGTDYGEPETLDEL